jgi:hypothetical protein
MNDHTEEDTTSSAPAKKKVTAKKPVAKKKAASRKKRAKKTPRKAAKPKRVDRPYPRATLEEAIEIPIAIRQKNGGNPWAPADVASAVGRSHKTNPFYYQATASRDFGLTDGTRDTAEISLTDLGRRLAYAEKPEEESETRNQAFLNVPLFKDVLEYYNGSTLPEMKYLKNTLEGKFGLDPQVHEEFADLFRRNCEYLGISEGIPDSGTTTANRESVVVHSGASDFVTVAEPETETNLLCFVAMPFSEKTSGYPAGFFSEVLRQLIAPAGRNAGFRVVTARKQGSDVIHATIVNALLDADLVVVDLTEHNPNVLFELGFRMREDKPVALIRAAGTSPIFDVDNMLRVEEYNPCLWPSTVEADLPKLTAHVKGAWDNRDSAQTYMKILRDKRSRK